MQDIPIIILCGGRGVALGDPPVRTLKPLVEIAGQPMVCHVLKHYVAAGFRRFLLALGGQQALFASALKESLGGDWAPDGALLCTSLSSNPVTLELIETGAQTTTGDRVQKLAERLGPAASFGVAYSDTLCSVDLAKVASAHLAHQKIATLVGARVPVRFRVLGIRLGETLVRGFAARPVILNDYINGGYYFFRREVLGAPYLGGRGTGVVLENEVLEALAAAEQLVAFPYEGGWQYLDAERHVPLLEKLARSGV